LFRWMLGAELDAKAVESSLPFGLLSAKPALRCPQGVGLELAGAYSARLGRCDQPGCLENSEVLNDSRQRHGQRLGELAHRRRSANQALDDGSPAGIRQGLEDPIEIQTVNHVPKYSTATQNSQAFT
jgi:hypothetical protein